MGPTYGTNSLEFDVDVALSWLEGSRSTVLQDDGFISDQPTEIEVDSLPGRLEVTHALTLVSEAVMFEFLLFMPPDRANEGPEMILDQLSTFDFQS